MTRVKITPGIVKWAQQRAGINDELLLQKMGLSNRPETLSSWLDNAEKPTFRQAQDLAKILRIPLGFLFLSEPPATVLPLADFRSVAVDQQMNFSPDLQDVLNDALRKRDWFRERRILEAGQPLPFVGKYRPGADPNEIAHDIRRTLALPEPGNLGVHNWREYLKLLVQLAESAGILVLQNSIVLNNTSRPLNVDEFRGFALSDEYAPLVFINGRDTVAARIFTLAHELGHIWTGDSGISNPETSLETLNQGPDAERLCNRIAAELLVPEQTFLAMWPVGQRPYAVAQALASAFLVSVFVILIRAYELRLIGEAEFHSAWARAREEIPDEPARPPSGGGNFYHSLNQRNSHLFTQEVTTAILEGALLHNEAARLLNIHHKSLENVLQEWQ